MHLCLAVLAAAVALGMAVIVFMMARAWQGMQYSLDMFTGDARLEPLDNQRYPDLAWTSVLERFASGHLPGTPAGTTARTTR